jgi:hypothetical protein
MKKDEIISYLNKFDYKYSIVEEKIEVILDFSLRITIDLSNQEKIIIKDKLNALNFLSWPFSMSIKGTMTYNFIGSLVVFALFLSIRSSYNNFVLTFIVLFCIFWNLYWLLYYLIKAENFKKEIKILTMH